MIRAAVVGCVLLAASFAGPAARVAAQPVPPDAEWFTFETEHFRVAYMAGLEDLARRAADRAERAHALLSREFVRPPEGRIELVVADHVDYANGNATPFPRNRIVAFAQPPALEASLANHEDWLEVLMLHELVHIFQFDNAGSIWPRLRTIFGRDPFLFPQIFAPGWLVEGLATYIESAYTSSGRIRGSTFPMILRTAILEDAFFPIDRVTLDPIAWPAGSSRYVYGAVFLDYLAERYGAGEVPALVRSLGRQLVPFRLDHVARGTLGSSASAAWREWEARLRVEVAALADSLAAEGLTSPEILTEAGWAAAHPRYSPDGRRIAYSANTARVEAAITILAEDGSDDRLVAISATDPVAWLSDTELVYPHLDFVGPYRIWSDLRRVSTAGEVDAITEDGRVWGVDPHPAGDRAVAVASAGGTNVLARVDLASGAVETITARDLDEYWAAPRWSPDGRRFAVSRWSPDGLFDIALVSGDGTFLGELASSPSVESEPTWSPDGRFVLFTSDRSGITNIYAVEPETGRLWRVTNVLTGAFQPDVSPDGRWIAFSYYRADGYHIARIPYDPSAWTEAPDEGTAGPLATEAELQAQAGGAARPYSPFPTILPTHWAVVLPSDPELGLGIGLGLSGEDVIERHLWNAGVLAYFDSPRLDADASYVYRGLGNPVLSIVAEQEWFLQAEAASGVGRLDSGDLLRRDRQIEGLVTWSVPGWRSRLSLRTGLDAGKIDFLYRDGEFTPTTPPRRYPIDVGARIGAGFSTVRGFARSLGAQDGFLSSVDLQARRYLEPLEWAPDTRDYLRLTARNRAYRGFDWFGFAPSVAALRIDGGMESDAGTPGFSLGGGSGDLGISPSLDFVRGGSSYPVRGFPAGAQRGSRIVNGSAEYRFPIALIERGFRLVPLGLDRVWGDLFVDAGAAWCPEACPAGSSRAPERPDPLVSIGAEAIVDIRIGYQSSLPLRFGVALPVRSEEGRDPVVYLRGGTSF